MDILKSASKLVFVLMAVSLVGLTAAGKVDPKDFVAMAGMAFAFYFSHKGNSNEPFGGK